MEKPASMPQQEYSGMTKSEKRQLPDSRGRDRSINVDGYPQLDVRFNQVEYKTPKTKANVIALCDSVVDMPNRENMVWYTDGQYQGGTAHSCDSVNLFDPDTNVIEVYSKQPDRSYSFLTTCPLTEREKEII
jgi:hypothetical protein